MRLLQAGMPDVRQQANALWSAVSVARRRFRHIRGRTAGPKRRRRFALPAHSMKFSRIVWPPLFCRSCSLAFPPQPAPSPVFRYALDRWPADNYRLEVSAVEAKDEAIAKFLRNLGTASALNLESSTPRPALRACSVRTPRKTAAPPVWTGTLNPAALASLTNSPARDEIVRRILAGDSAAWVLVESGDGAADGAAAKTLEKRLRYLEELRNSPPSTPMTRRANLAPAPSSP